MTLEPVTAKQPIEPAEATLEQACIAGYLRAQGLSMEQLRELPREQADEVMRAASLYASLQMSEVEAHSHLMTELHGGLKPI